MGDLHLASVAEKEEVEERDQWRHSQVKGEIDTPRRKDPGAPFVLGIGGRWYMCGSLEGATARTRRNRRREESA